MGFDWLACLNECVPDNDRDDDDNSSEGSTVSGTGSKKMKKKKNQNADKNYEAPAEDEESAHFAKSYREIIDGAKTPLLGSGGCKSTVRHLTTVERVHAEA